MTTAASDSLDEQRRVLREKMRAQRQLIAKELGPEPEDNRGYPRSKTMRFMTSRPGLSVTVLSELAALALGARHAKIVTAALALSRIVRSAAGNGAARPRGPQP
jgi:hypothetical protein